MSAVTVDEYIRYPGREQPAVLDPGDVVFFGGHVLHRSHANRSPDRLRRSFASRS
jgi:ectoine hydroxylase-related dioxygenase (phytanoyl-CoA dioxygenase family)